MDIGLDDYARPLVCLARRLALESAKETSYQGIFLSFWIKGFIEEWISRYIKEYKQEIIKLYQERYPNEEVICLENLSLKQYDDLFILLQDNEDLDKILHVIQN